MRDYALHFIAIAAAQQRARDAENALQEQSSKMRRAAINEATAALAQAGVVVGQTILTQKGRWPYQDKPVLIERLTCWSTPMEIQQGWTFQAHICRVKKDREPDDRCNSDYCGIRTGHPSAIAAPLLRRLPIWQNDPCLTSRATVEPAA